MKKREIIKNVIRNKRVVTEPDYRDMGAILLFIFLFPYIVSFFFGYAGNGTAASKEETNKNRLVMKEEIFQDNYEDAEYIVCNTTAAGVERLPLETYLVSRLPATIDMEYEGEVLKAQAVVLRTELLRMYYETAEKKDNVEKKLICTEGELPKVSGSIYKKSSEAVASTRGMYMVYEGTVIMAPYFAVSAGKTRNGNEIFQSEEYPYLQSVECGRDFTAENYVQTVKLDKDFFYQRLRELGDSGREEAMQIQRDSAGYVTEASYGNTYCSGERIREAFSLNSSCFEWEEEQNQIVIRVKGVGHGLGLCHYGANEKAKEGSDYIDILNYFFSDIVIEKTQ